MRLYNLVVAVAFFSPVISAPGYMIPVEKVDGETSGRHIVRLKPGVDQSLFFDATNIITTHNWTVINGFSGKFTEDQINALRAHHDVDLIAEDGIAQASLITTQTNAPWGLARLSSVTKLANQNPSDRNFRFVYDTTGGLGVDIYVVDTGVYIQHTEFGGRARWGATFGGYASLDGNGHGTHCAGTAAGRTIGVARAASIIAVKVLGDDGRGAVSDIISGVNWVYNQAKASGRPSIMSMSIGAGPSTAFDSAVTSVYLFFLPNFVYSFHDSQLTTIGVHAIVSAGNNNQDASTQSPARAPGAVAVGASNIADARASFSNYGSLVALFAPGENIVSAWYTGTTTYATLSGTSMSTPCISGLVAYLISSKGRVSPAVMRTNLKNLSVKGILTNIPVGTVNQLAQNGLAPK